MTLHDLFFYLNESGEFRINLHDASGIFTDAPFSLTRSLRIHDQPFCDAAKSTKKGYEVCIRCKATVCKKALRQGKPFFGVCPYGLFELVYPIADNGKILCILFIGNCVRDPSESLGKAESTCRKTDVPLKLLSPFLTTLPRAREERMLGAARLIEEYIRLLLASTPPAPRTYRPTHWVTRSMAEYARENFRAQITLKHMAKLYFMNEKYIGKLFCRQMGVSFHQYVTDLRLDTAARLLRSTELPILEVALESGFQTVSYFNRTFFAKFATPPSAYRRAHREGEKE